MNPEEQKVLDSIAYILHQGDERTNRTGVVAKSVFGLRFEFNLENGTFPLQTSRALPLKTILSELKWICSGQTKTTLGIWKANTTREFIDAQNLEIPLEEGDIGASYGFQMRHFGADMTRPLEAVNTGYDQLAQVIHLLRHNPQSRRILISLWNPCDLSRTPLPPCMFMYQFYVSPQGLECQVNSRSSDIALAGGWNVAFAALLTFVVGKLSGHTPKRLIWVTGDTHIYEPNYESARVLSERIPKPFPRLSITSRLKDIDDIQNLEVSLEGYEYVKPNLSFKMIA